MSNPNKRPRLPAVAALVMMIAFVVAGCSSTGAAMAEPTAQPGGSLPAASTTPKPTATPTIARPPTELPTLTYVPSSTPIIPTLLPTPVPTATLYVQPAAEEWKRWPVLPVGVSEAMRQVYQMGLLNGTDPNAFTVLGDCQGDSETFLGAFKLNPELVAGLTPGLQETVAQFDRSFDRYNPAAKSGSSAGSLLWSEWNDNLEGKCAPGETPLDCELRVHRPSIVFVHVGTHYEVPDRNLRYLTIIIERILATGAVPVMVTKADKLEGDDEYVNRNIATLAEQYELPLWNFWASVQNLPANGLLPNGMHLTDDAHVVHRIGALETLDVVWRALQ